MGHLVRLHLKKKKNNNKTAKTKTTKKKTAQNFSTSQHNTHPKNFSRVIVLVRLLIIQEGIHKQKNVQPQPGNLEEKAAKGMQEELGKVYERDRK